jgi:4-amino-4-deoxy-L-arabinose transferase-like glycosyltransferase
MPDRSRLPLALAIALTLAIWLTGGLFGREPWKADEGYSFGLVLSAVEHGQWLVPTLAGEPFLEKPPLVFWLAAGLARLLQDWLPMHVAARGANVLLLLATFGLLAACAVPLMGRTRALLAVLLLAGSPAAFVASRYLTADVGLLPAAAGVCLAFGRLYHGRRDAGLILGLSCAAGLLSKGLILPFAAAGAWLLLPLSRRVDRGRLLIQHGLVALGVFLLVGGAWPWLLYEHSPELFRVWIWDNNFGRFLGDNTLGPSNTRLSTLGALAGFLLPVWPMAAWYAWRHGRELRESALWGPALFALVWVAALLASSTARVIYALPVLVPLALIGAAALPERVGIDRIWSIRAMWLLAGALALSGVIAKLAIMQTRPSSVHASGPLLWPLLLLGTLAALAWAWAWLAGARPRPLVGWSTGMTLAAAFALALFLPAIDAGTGFKSVFQSLARGLPHAHGCVASLALGESERAMLEYYAGLRTVRVENGKAAAAQCRFLVEQQRRDEREGFGCVAATQVWAGSRASDPQEVFRLCERPDAVSSAAAVRP